MHMYIIWDREILTEDVACYARICHMLIWKYNISTKAHIQSSTQVSLDSEQQLDK